MDLSFARDGRRLATGTFDGLVRVWRLPPMDPSPMILAHSNRVYHVEFSPDGSRMLTAGADGAARVWDVATWRPAIPPLVHHLAINCGVQSGRPTDRDRQPGQDGAGLGRPQRGTPDPALASQQPRLARGL